MDTTISDISKFVALLRGDGPSPTSRREMTKSQLTITTAHPFPVFGEELPANQQRKDLFMGVGVAVFDGPQGHGFYNDLRREAAYPDLVRFILGETGVPFDWEYGDYSKP